MDRWNVIPRIDELVIVEQTTLLCNTSPGIEAGGV